MKYMINMWILYFEQKSTFKFTSIIWKRRQLEYVHMDAFDTATKKYA